MSFNTGDCFMAQASGIVIAGVSGRMGQMLVRLITDHSKVRLAGALEREGHDWIGQDLGVAMGGARAGIKVSDDVTKTFADAQAVIDFTAAGASVSLAHCSARAKIVHVIGTTGFSDEQLQAIRLAAQETVIIRAGNMSLGVNLLVQLTKRVAAVLDDDYDIEVLEAHHGKKIDAPSGTALMLGSAAAEGRNVILEDVADRVRDGITGERARGHIGFATIRGGDVVGEHDVIFAGPGERLVLRHVASDRALFARGAIRAALWGQGKPTGEYSMVDVLGL